MILFRLESTEDHWRRDLTSDSTFVEVREAGSETTLTTFYDTFDWRLRHAGLCSLQTLSHHQLVELSTGRVVESGRAVSKRGGRLFATDFPVGGLRRRLSGIIDVRALLERFSRKTRRRSFDILNADGKIVVRVDEIDHVSPLDPPRSTRLLMARGLRGYMFELNCLERTLSGSDGRSPLTYQRFLDEELSFNGLIPIDYSSKPAIALTPKATLGEAAVSICLSALKVIRLNEEGVKRDLDSEFLHDFRVSIRRGRAALGQIGGAFPPEKTEALKNDLSFLGKLTNAPRDLDVFFLKRDDYAALVPVELRAGLTKFFVSLKRKRCRERRKLVDVLNSPRYESTLTQWERFLTTRGRDGAWGSEADRSALTEASKAIRKRFRKVVTAGRSIGPDTPDERLHKVRIHCKKLRYLLEFFASLYPKEAVHGLVRQLKTLQNNLGDHNDLSVHIKLARKHLSTISPKRSDSLERAAAVGALIGALTVRKRWVRSQFETTFNDFSGEENAKTFSKLFG